MFQIMVVEDDKSTARLMQTVLQYEGYNVVLTENGENALDIMMSKMDDYQFTETLHTVDEHMLILMVTEKQLPKIQMEKLRRKDTYQRPAKTRGKFNDGGRTIKKRPKYIYSREEPGYWERDTVVSGRKEDSSKYCFVTLVEVI